MVRSLVAHIFQGILNTTIVVLNQKLANSEEPETREKCAVALYNMSSHKVSRRVMLQRGGADVLIRLSKTARTAEGAS
jgi:hypothetical protein